MLTPNPSLHQRIATTIAEEISAGRLRPADRLPSEADLGKQFGVSRATIRSALSALARDGLVDTHPGRGSFVSAAVSEEPNTLMSFTEMGRQSGLAASARVLTQKVVSATLDDAEQLGVAAGSEVFVLDRLRLLDRAAVSIDRSRIPLALAPGLPEADFRTDSLYSVLDRSGTTPVRAEYAVQAVAADARQAKLLGVDVGTPLLQTTTTSYTASGDVIELGEMSYRGDRYRFRATLRRAPSGR